MRERLIKELQKISTIKRGDEPDYMVSSLLDELDLEVEKLQKRARAVFKDLLQAYEQVAISTIDKFNHTLIKSFSRDLDIPSDFEVETDEKEIFRKAIDELVSRVGTDEHITKHLINFVEYKLDEESKVSIHSALENLFGLCIGEASYKALDEIGKIEKEQFELISKKLQREIKEAEKMLSPFGAKALKLIDSAGLSENDFIQKGRGVYGFFQNVETKKPQELKFPKSAENALDGTWMSKNASKSQLDALSSIQDDLQSVLMQIHTFFNEDLKALKLKQAVRSNIDLIAVLTALSDIFKELCNRERVIPISRFNKLISDALRKEPVSFIYEQIGARYDHILVDEFQDTSQLQWYNLLPLIDESISRGKYNMVVGDAKQSIYRWRGGKAEQLIDLPKLFEAPSDIAPEIERNLEANSQINRLLINYRSLEEIVVFNNEIIRELSNQAIPPNSLYSAEYTAESFRQKHREGKTGGYIEINELEKSDEKEDWSDLISQINICRDRGYNFGDMAILVRSAQNEGKSITRTLLAQNIPVVSKESYDIGEYQPVKMVIAFLRLSIDPLHNPSKIQILKGFSSFIGKPLDYEIYTDKKHLNLSKFLKDLDLKPFDGYNHLSVFDAVDEIHSDYLSKIQHPALDTLKESIYSKFGLSGSIRNFFEFWDNEKDKPSIKFGDTGNSIELLTIHKAKGLQYKVVFLPELSWKLRATNNETAWFSMKNHPISLPYAPLRINSKLADKGLEMEYQIEENANQFDNLNLVYVALTRAEEALFISTYDKGKGTVGKWMKNALEALFDKSETILEAEIEEKETGRKISIGNLLHRDVMQETEREDHQDATFSRLKIWKKGLDFAHVVENRDQITGNIFHELISKAHNLDPFKRLVERKWRMGIIGEEEKQRLFNYGKTLLSNPIYSELIEEGKIISEREILHKRKVIRPDLIIEKENEQIVIDFKTGSRSVLHDQQLIEYMDACENMGMKNVNGFVIYLDPFEIIPVLENSGESQMKLF